MMKLWRTTIILIKLIEASMILDDLYGIYKELLKNLKEACGLKKKQMINIFHERLNNC